MRKDRDSKETSKCALIPLDVILPRIGTQKLDGLVWHKARIHKHAFSTWLFVLDRNPTLDRLLRWGCDVEQTCLLCVSAEVWRMVLALLHFPTPPTSWNSILLWLPGASNDKFMRLALLQAWQACIYEIWRERNRRFHDGISFSPTKIFHLVRSVVRIRAQSLCSRNSDYVSLLLCWSSPP
ncbi:uncharacterized protein LOC112085039 [Eutrema salsugineum]|uniref:uncharacterized protein LOC112085039 n=1 Tax=Eutrema salsugineum TaxID=72664 RepID=UPI000CED3314|nr:uncharacterized protein LOC112085039 [Eutrema salsugineum]